MNCKRKGLFIAGAAGLLTVGATVLTVRAQAAPGIVAPRPAAPAAAPTAAGRPATNPSKAAENARKTVEVLVVRGADAIALGDIKAARDCLVDAIQLDPRNRKALE